MGGRRGGGPQGLVQTRHMRVLAFSSLLLLRLFRLRFGDYSSVHRVRVRRPVYRPTSADRDVKLQVF